MPRPLLIASDRIWTGGDEPTSPLRPGRPGWIRVSDGVIEGMGHGAAPGPVDVDLTGQLVVPGFVDIHNHGGGGAGYEGADPSAVATAAAAHRRHGTTTLLASLVSAPVDALAAAVAGLAPLVVAGIVAGVHLEGPFLSAARRGAHDRRHLRSPRPEDLDRLLAAGPGVVRMMTVAPELDGGLPAVRRIVGAGVVAAIGHTDASYEVVQGAIDAGATVATHLCNGMAPPHHRSPGPVIACLDDDRVVVELIADGVHLHDRMLRHLATVAGRGRTILVTDAVAAAGLGDGDYRLGTQRVVVRHGAVRLVGPESDPGEGGVEPSGPGTLAGSVLTLDVALRHAVDAGIPLSDALAAVTSVPAGAVGLGSQAGALAPGRRADLVALDDDLVVRAVLAAGRRVTVGAAQSAGQATRSSSTTRSGPIEGVS